MEELKKVLEQSQNKLEVFGDVDKIVQYDMTIQQLVDIIQESLSDEEKEKLFEFSHFQNLKPHIREKILAGVRNDEIKIRMIKDQKVTSGIFDYTLQNMMEGLGDAGVLLVLNDEELLNQYDKHKITRVKMIKNLSSETKEQLAYDHDFLEGKLGLETGEISQIVASIDDDKIKMDLMGKYEFNDIGIVEIAGTLSDDSKVEFLLENQFDLSKHKLKDIVKKLSMDKLVEFVNNETQFFEQNELSMYEVTRVMDKQTQLEFISRIEEMNLSLNEKRKVFATLNSETKQDLDVGSLREEFVSAVSLKINEDITDFNSYGKIIVDLDKDLESYKGLDDLIYINGMKITQENKDKLLKLCEICPEIRITDNLNLSASKVEEYVSAEAWIDSVVQDMDPEWSTIQKVAFIDNAIGKKISYTPDFDTEVSADEDARALWKIIHSGYGVCNGIAQVEKYIFDKVGIESEEVSGVRHAFLKLKNIELPTSSGETVVGDTILDPTWNLVAHRFGSRPENFCVSYEEIRKNDIASDGRDMECHKNDQVLSSATIGLDEQSLRSVFSSIGLADREGKFPITELFDKAKEIDDQNLDMEESIRKQFDLLKEYCPEFATCPNSTMRILQGVLLNQEKQDFNRCVVNRVYDRADAEKKPVMYVYVNMPGGEKKFYFADKDKEEFLELPQKEFEARFECYEMDMQRQDNCRPWEEVEQEEIQEDLTRSSGNVIAYEGEEI